MVAACFLGDADSDSDGDSERASCHQATHVQAAAGLAAFQFA